MASLESLPNKPLVLITVILFALSAQGCALIPRDIELKFVRAYYRIGDPTARKGLRKLVQAMANLA